MTTHDPRAWTAGRAIRVLALATLSLTACAQLLIAAFAEEVDELAPRPLVDSGFELYLDTTPYLLDSVPEGFRDLPAITRSPPPPDGHREVFPSPLATPEAELATPSLRKLEP